MISVLVPTLYNGRKSFARCETKRGTIVNIVRLRFLGLFFDMLHSKRAH